MKRVLCVLLVLMLIFSVQIPLAAGLSELDELDGLDGEKEQELASDLTQSIPVQLMSISALMADISDLEITADKITSLPGGEIVYTIRATLPDDLKDIEVIEIFKGYDPGKVKYNPGNAVLTIGGAALAGSDFTIADSASGLLIATLDDSVYSFTGIGGKELELKMTFTMASFWSHDERGETRSSVRMAFDSVSVGETSFVDVWVIRDRVIVLVGGESQYTVDMMPIVTRTTKYLYTDESFDDAYLIGVWPEQTGITNTAVSVGQGEKKILWVKYVEDFFYSPTTIYYRFEVIGPSDRQLAYMASMAGQSTHPAIGGGTRVNPFTATIYVPLAKESITNPVKEQTVGHDIQLIGYSNAYKYIFNDASFTDENNFLKIVPLNIGANHVYVGVHSPSAAQSMYYDVTVYRGAPFSKTADATSVARGGKADYTINLTLPGNIGTFGEVLIVDEYPADQISYIAGSATLKIGNEVLNPGTDYQISTSVVNNEGKLTVKVIKNLSDYGDLKLVLKLAFNVAVNAKPTVENIAQFWLDDDLYGEGKATIAMSTGGGNGDGDGDNNYNSDPGRPVTERPVVIDPERVPLAEPEQEDNNRIPNPPVPLEEVPKTNYGGVPAYLMLLAALSLVVLYMNGRTILRAQAGWRKK